MDVNTHKSSQEAHTAVNPLQEAQKALETPEIVRPRPAPAVSKMS